MSKRNGHFFVATFFNNLSSLGVEENIGMRGAFFSFFFSSECAGVRKITKIVLRDSLACLFLHERIASFCVLRIFQIGAKRRAGLGSVDVTFFPKESALYPD
ncbi:hypothetical protein CDAR_100741 [Caerostris darwini]|uniref:Uncharacterized protein n=1 Tax=Caerostris darwini TaxID=1538125 RepID=A0AAV4VXK1_9ARAC|nr:hypothetical protein CDAR_100741 [Caerostris darwini]